jgi:hypothetical protein
VVAIAAEKIVIPATIAAFSGPLKTLFWSFFSRIIQPVKIMNIKNLFFQQI